MDKKVIAFGHQKEVGKSTSAKFLDTYFRTTCPKLRVKNVGFADKLKDISFQLFSWAGLRRGVYYETHYKEKEVILPDLGLSPRDIWIAVGNNLREVWSYVWLDFVLKNVKADIIIISDLRFQNEVVAIKNAGGFVVKINRDVPKGTDPAEVDLVDWEYWDHIIDNNGTLQKLNDVIVTLAKDLLKI